MYAVLAIIGGAMAIVGVPNLSFSGMGVLTLGGIAAFLQLSRNFIQPICQVSQQLNSVVMAMAGAERIFQLMDEKTGSRSRAMLPWSAPDVTRTARLRRCKETHRRCGPGSTPIRTAPSPYTELRGDVRLARCGLWL